jgi:hypothetical protein
MATLGDNNPRAFGDAVSLDAWRTKYDESSGEADLHVNVVFSQGRIGGDENSPIRFRLQLLRAEVHVIRDAAQVIAIRPSSVQTGRRAAAEESVKVITETEAKGQVRAGLSSNPDISAGSEARKLVRDETTFTRTDEPIVFVSMKTDHGYLFRIEPSTATALSGSPWSSEVPLLKILDSKKDRKHGEAPEVRVELRCRREDMHITDIQLTESASNITYSANKILAVEQYIRSELLKIGFLVPSLTDPFSEAVIADVVPEED